jgi:hypothetical protein
MMSMSRVIRYAAGLAIVLAISAQVAQAGPNHLTWKGEQVGPQRGPMVYTPTVHRDELVLGGTVRQPNAVIHVTDLVNEPGVKEDTFRGRGLAGVNVSGDTDVTGTFERVLAIGRV